jgi:WD40 repeat protein
MTAQRTYAAPFVHCRFEPTGRYVFASAEDRTVQRWRMADGARTAFAGHESWVFGLAFADRGATLLTVGGDGRLIWHPSEAAAPKPIRVVQAHDGWARCIAVSPDDKWIATGGNDELLKIWNARDGKLVHSLVGHKTRVYSVLFARDSRTLYSGDLRGGVKQWDVSSGKLIGDFPANELHSYNAGQGVDYGGVRSLSLNADGKRLACSGLFNASNPLGAVNEPLVLVFDAGTRKKIRGHIAPGVVGVAWRASYHPSGTLIGCSGGTGGGFLVFWSPEQDKDFFRLQLPNTARDFDLHPDGVTLAVTHHDRQVRIYRMAKS